MNHEPINPCVEYEVESLVRRAKALHPSGGQSRPATVVPAVMLSI